MAKLIVCNKGNLAVIDEKIGFAVILEKGNQTLRIARDPVEEKKFIAEFHMDTVDVNHAKQVSRGKTSLSPGFSKSIQAKMLELAK